MNISLLTYPYFSNCICQQSHSVHKSVCTCLQTIPENVKFKEQAAKLGFFITGPRASTSLKHTGPTLISLAQLVHVQMKTYRSPIYFTSRSIIRGNYLKWGFDVRTIFSVFFLLSLILSNSHWPTGPVDETKPLAQHSMYWPRASG